MPKSLVIVESPAKAKTINKYLGPDYVVEASVGHVKDLPKDGLSIDVEGGFVPTYEVMHGKKDVIARLKNLAGRCDRVFLATDPDREGEAIANHIADEIRSENKNIKRVVFNEITKAAIGAAMRKPRDIDRQMVEAQEARRVMDRLIGYKVSPFLWRRFTGESRGLSAGRVQSVALRLVVEREKAILSFIPIEYWNLLGHFRTPRGEEIIARLVRHDGIDLKNPQGSAEDLKKETGPRSFISNEGEAEALRERAVREQYAITSIVRKEVKRNAPPPFTTSTLQQDAGRRLRVSSKRAMELAQKLYEGVELGGHGRVGLITYMRTDSVRVSDEAMEMAEQYIYENFGKDYLPPARKDFKQKGKNVQDAHEAIRPTDLKITPKEARKHLDKEMADLYELVWSRFVASQMAPALIDQTTVDIEGGPFLFRATGRITRFKGWLQVYADPEEKEAIQVKGKEGSGEDDEKEDDRALPEKIKKGEKLTLEKVHLRQSFTKPPPRYTEALLVKEMEAKGIGRPSTYASIIATVQERGYVEQRERKLYATELGIKVSDALVGQFPTLFDVKFTARMEGDLDTIASGSATYLKVMKGFYSPFQKSLASAGIGEGVRGRVGEGGQRGGGKTAEKVKGRKSDVVCQKCGSAMELRKGEYGYYVACLGFPACRNIISANEDGTLRDGRVQVTGKNGESGAGAKSAGKKNGKAKSGAEGEPAETGAEGASAPEKICKSCGAPMQRRHGKSGEFFGCTNYPNCRQTEPIPIGVTCPLCNVGGIAERIGGRYNSTFYGCTRYPDCRFTSSLKPVNTHCTHCGNPWMTLAFEKDQGEFLECPKCRKRGEG
jgi:DNA topoisomerase-1